MFSYAQKGGHFSQCFHILRKKGTSVDVFICSERKSVSTSKANLGQKNYHKRAHPKNRFKDLLGIQIL
jgi:hypothetical protein